MLVNELVFEMSPKPNPAKPKPFLPLLSMSCATRSNWVTLLNARLLARFVASLSAWLFRVDDARLFARFIASLRASELASLLERELAVFSSSEWARFRAFWVASFSASELARFFEACSAACSDSDF